MNTAQEKNVLSQKKIAYLRSNCWTLRSTRTSITLFCMRGLSLMVALLQINIITKCDKQILSLDLSLLLSSQVKIYLTWWMSYSALEPRKSFFPSSQNVVLITASLTGWCEVKNSLTVQEPGPHKSQCSQSTFWN